MTKQVPAQITPAAAMSGLVAQAIAQGEATKAEKTAKAAPAKKPAAKKATPAKTSTKTASKAVKPATTANTKKAAGTSTARGSIKYGVLAGGRPVAGRSLYAFTDAWLRGFGLDKEGGKIDRAVAIKVAGATAIGYHVNTAKNMTEKGGMLSLTAKGRRVFFEERPVDEKLSAAILQALRTGTPDGEVLRTKDIFQALA